MFPKIEKRRAFRCVVIFAVNIFALSMFLPMSYASQDIVGSDYNYGTQLGISEVLYKDTSEQDPNYDYYAIKALISDVMFQNDFWTSPLLAYVRIAVPLWAGTTR